ncbi:MAG: HAMP domain-containing sensor histidine kinase [Flavobacterium sp.]
MTIKSKISLYISILFTVLFGVICIALISLFSNFRKQEFEERLNEKAVNTIKLLIEVKEFDNKVLKIIDRNSINQLYDEKTLIFDQNYKLIYSSLDDTKIKWTTKDLDYLRKNKSFFRKDQDNEIYGFFYDTNYKDYYALISANDNYGKRTLNFLIYILIGAYLFFTTITWLLTLYIIKKQLNPLQAFHKKISAINDLNLDITLETNKNSRNEISLLSTEFNFMMNRISDAYQKQKEFTAQASHELRTPIARISAQLENQLQNTDAKNKAVLKTIFSDIDQLNELINSLLVLSKIDSQNSEAIEKTRVDEAIYDSIQKVNTQFEDFKINFTLEESDELFDLLEINGNQKLLEIAFSNLLKNAYLYSDEKVVNVVIKTIDGKLTLSISNTGKTLSETEQNHLFQPFMRGENARNTSGLGLGLRIVSRILNAYGYSITYTAKEDLNTFRIIF